jgi:bifunctional non-homologous end joining protein LigD
MSLVKYAQKRDFKKTAEPIAGRSKDKDHLMFVIQKHDASRLHYDFRLEMDGVLKSWAVPKGPSTDPKTKRLAMMVEDHPFDYRNFEGIIPQGQYGGGTVIVWDEGTYEPIEEIKGKKAQEKYLLAQLKSGSLKIKLHGKKLEGEYALVKTHGINTMISLPVLTILQKKISLFYPAKPSKRWKNPAKRFGNTTMKKI